MRNPGQVSTFSKSVLAGALTGLSAAITNLVYDVIFRNVTRFEPAEEFNFFTITFISMITLLVIGIIFFLFLKYFNATSYIVVILIAVIAGISVTIFSHHAAGTTMLSGNNGLTAGFILISGMLAIILLPYFYRHPKIYI